jgi:hypothetical protein
MAMDPTLEKRLAMIETAIADLQCRLENNSAASNWLERFTGSFKDEPAFAEVVEYGRAFRAVDRLTEEW